MNDSQIQDLLLNGDSGSEIEDHLEIEDYDSDDSVADPTLFQTSKKMNYQALLRSSLNNPLESQH